MSSNRSGRVLVAAALVAALFLAVPAGANDGREVPQGPLGRLAAWFGEIWLSAGLPGGMPQNPPPTVPPGEEDDDDDPEGCRDYTACIDPNG